ncbi:hypothetical protein NX059_002190 [Plenodomus lindquistii]|nr:hypothetical protein NX059_002190 [Plenodomus lindquistii]
MNPETFPYFLQNLPLLFLSFLSAIANRLQPLPQPVVDVAVIGGGLSGLTAAQHLLLANKTVLVLEARTRVGGKVYNYPLKNGRVTEVGAEFVGSTQDRILALIQDLGLELFDTYTTGSSILWRNGTRIVYTPRPSLDGAPLVAQKALVQVSAAQTQLDT